MLSKYYYLEEDNMNTFRVDMNIFVSALIGELQKHHKEIALEQIYPGGTLGIFFSLYIDGKRKFVKTHQEGEKYHNNLLKEIKIMSIVYKDIIEVEQLTIIVNEREFTVMIMDFLTPVNNDIDVYKTRECIKNYQQRLNINDLVVDYTFTDVIKASVNALETLYTEKFLANSIYERCKESIRYVSGCYNKLPKTICHGDLSNVNIMCNDVGQLVVIDWEDSLTAFSEYDFLYWLTFFSQRKYYSNDLLTQNGIDKIWGVDIMIIITIVKSEMSYRNASYKKNRISFQERICEIYNMTN